MRKPASSPIVQGPSPVEVEARVPQMSSADARAAQRVAERLRAELAHLIRAFPVERRKISEMARWLGVTRPICQRVVQAVRERGDPLTSLQHLPGVQGLASFVEAARHAGCDRAAVDAAHAAAAQYADLIDRHGGSQAGLLAAIERYLAAASAEEGLGDIAPGLDTGDSVRARQQIFEGARALTGREIGAHVGVFIYRPSDGSPDLMDCVTALALHDVRMREDALPISPVSIFAHGDPDEAPDGLQIGALEEAQDAPLPIGRMDRFCSVPAPPVLARRRGGRVTVLVEPDSSTRSRFDAVLGARLRDLPDPATHVPRMQTCFVNTDGPARWLVIAVHLHRSLAMRSLAMTGAYIRDRVAARIPGPANRVHVLTPEDLWMNRLPDVPRLEYLGLGLEQADAPAYPRQRELTQHLFDLQAWDPGEFVGFRIQVDFPVWNAQYLINFDFPSDADHADEIA